MGKISDIKKANKAKNKGRTQKKLDKRQKERLNKKNKGKYLLEKAPVTYYDFKRIREREKAERIQFAKDRDAKKEDAIKKKKKEQQIPMREDAEDMLDPIELEDMISAEDQRVEDTYIEEDEDDDKKKLVKSAKQLLLGQDEDEEEEEEPEEEGDTIHASAAEQQHHNSIVYALQQKAAEKQAAATGDPANDLLPIVVANKVIKPSPAAAAPQQADDSGIEHDCEEEEVAEEAPVPQRTVSVIEILAQRKRKIHEKKILIGCLATKIVSNPNGNMAALKELLKLVYEQDVDVMITIRKMACLTLVSIFDSILPNYRLATMDVPGTRLKKSTRAVAVEEGKLLSRYKYFLKGLEGMLDHAEAKKYAPVQLKLAVVALKCFCHLLHKHPVFNFSDNIRTLVIPYLSHKLDEPRAVVVESFEKIFYEDNTGQFSLNLLKVIDKFIRKRNFQVHADVLRVLLKLRVIHATALDTSSARKIESMREAAAVEQNLKKLASKNTGRTLSINEKKHKRKIAKLEFKLQHKKREEKKHQADTIQTEMLHIMFGIYLHCIKHNPNRRLLGMVLEGLSKFGHLVDVSFFCDLLSNLHRVLIEQQLSLLESVHCIQTVFKLLTGLGTALPNDPSNFSEKLFVLLPQLMDKDNRQVALPMLRTVVLIFIGCKKRMGDLQSVGFAKRLATVSLALQHSQAIPMLMTLRSIMLNHPNTESLLDLTGEGGSGIYRPDLNHPIHCNASMTAVYETTLLPNSYHPMVRQIGIHLSKGAPLLGEGCLPASFTKLNIDEVWGLYDGSTQQLQPRLLDPVNHCGEKMLWSNQKKKLITRHRMSMELQSIYEEQERKTQQESCLIQEDQEASSDVDSVENQDNDVDMVDIYSDDGENEDNDVDMNDASSDDNDDEEEDEINENLSNNDDDGQDMIEEQISEIDFYPLDLNFEMATGAKENLDPVGDFSRYFIPEMTEGLEEPYAKFKVKAKY